LSALALTLAACGGSSGNGDNNPQQQEPTPVTVAGKVTGFGSIYVNGIRFETNSAIYDLDDMTGSGDSDVSVGMHVVIAGTVNVDGVSGTASSVYYEDDVEGPVTGLGAWSGDPANTDLKAFTVFGTTVVIDLASTVFEAEDGSAWGFDTIMNGYVVEVSGDYVGGELFASFVELQDILDDEYEVEGTISGWDMTNQFTLNLANGSSLTVQVADGAEIPDSGIADDLYVEVEGTVPDPVVYPGVDLLASKVEIEDEDDFDSDDDEVEKKGPLSYDEMEMAWSVNGTVLAFSGSTIYEPTSLADAIEDFSAHGLYVEVEGRYVDGVLQVAKIEIEEDDLEFEAYATVVAATGPKAGTISLSFGGATGTLPVVINGDTFFMDDDAVTPFDLRTLPDNTKVEIDARRNDAGDIVASMLELEDSMGVAIEGPVDAVSETSVSILGIGFTISVETIVEGVPSTEVYGEIEDANEDGTADVVEFDD
jgi:predicted RNA-binding protein